MKIVRVVNGVEMEFELTSQELYDAFEEQEHIADMAYIEDEFGQDPCFDGMAPKVRKQALSDIAWKYRCIADDNLTPKEIYNFDIACRAMDEYFGVE